MKALMVIALAVYGSLVKSLYFSQELRGRAVPEGEILSIRRECLVYYGLQ